MKEELNNNVLSVKGHLTVSREEAKGKEKGMERERERDLSKDFRKVSEPVP